MGVWAAGWEKVFKDANTFLKSIFGKEGRKKREKKKGRKVRKYYFEGERCYVR